MPSNLHAFLWRVSTLFVTSSLTTQNKKIIRNKFVCKDTLVYLDEQDFLWVKISKTTMSAENDLYICICYIIPEESSRQSMIESNVYDRLLDSVVFIESKTNVSISIAEHQ